MKEKKEKIKAYLRKQANEYLDQAGNYALDTAKAIVNDPYKFKATLGGLGGAAIGYTIPNLTPAQRALAMAGGAGLGGLAGMADAGLMDWLGIYGDKTHQLWK